MNIPTHVKLVEVGPRDGLQNETLTLSPAQRIQMVESLVNTGLTYVEVGSFVSPKWVPQMASTDEVFAGITKRDHVTYAALAPNMRGLEAAIGAGVAEIAVFASASEAFSQRNINCSIQESMDRFAPVIALALEHGIRVRGYVSCVLGCPYEGTVIPQQVAAVSLELADMGCYEISLGDTIGCGTAGQTRALIDIVGSAIDRSRLAGHFHDTYGQALTNIYASLLEGVAVFDSSVAGLGGCPYAGGASGNVATEDVLYMLNGLGIHTGVELDKLILIGQWVCNLLGRQNGSCVASARC